MYVAYPSDTSQRPFDATSENALSAQIQAANPRYPITQPPVSQDCIHAMRAALDPNRDKRMGSTWGSFIHNSFFRCIDFEALEMKLIEPVFVPSAEKTNFDATWDLEELLLEEAPLEARARRQKPRERLKNDASEQEIREDELYRVIETEFRPFDYTVAAYKKYCFPPFLFTLLQGQSHFSDALFQNCCAGRPKLPSTNPRLRDDNYPESSINSTARACRYSKRIHINNSTDFWPRRLFHTEAIPKITASPNHSERGQKPVYAKPWLNPAAPVRIHPSAAKAVIPEPGLTKEWPACCQLHRRHAGHP